MDNYQTRVTPAKEDAVKALKEEFEGYNGFIFTDYRGMTVAQITELRNTLRKNDAQYRVVKNRYAKIAFRNLGKSGADDQMVGPTAVALAKGDETNVVAKALFEAIKNGVPMQVKGAIVDGEVMDGALQASYQARAHRFSHGNHEGSCPEACRYAACVCRIEGWSAIRKLNDAVLVFVVVTC